MAIAKSTVAQLKLALVNNEKIARQRKKQSCDNLRVIKSSLQLPAGLSQKERNALIYFNLYGCPSHQLAFWVANNN